MDEYLAFISSDAFGQRKVMDLVNPAEFRKSVFSTEPAFDRQGENKYNPLLLKKILMLCFGDSFDTVKPSDVNTPRGSAEKNAFLERHPTLTLNTTFSEFIKEKYPA